MVRIISHRIVLGGILHYRDLDVLAKGHLEFTSVGRLRRFDGVGRSRNDGQLFRRSGWTTRTKTATTGDHP